jgi:general secretion pathway protein D
MMKRYLRVIAGLVLTLAMVATGLTAKGKAEKFFQDGQAAEHREDWDKALELYLLAMDEKPNDPAYMIAMRRARFQSGAKHVSAGQKLRLDGKVEEAMAEFQKALIADPASSIAIQEMRRTQQILDAEKKLGTPKSQDRGLTPAERERKDTEDRISSMLPPPELKPIMRTIPPLTMNNQPIKVIFDTVGKLAGVNVLFDTQFTPATRNFNVNLPAGSPIQAFDYLAVETHTFWKAISSNTIFVTEDNATKHRDFDDEVVKTVYVQNTTSVQDFQEIVQAVRSLTEIRRTFQSNPQRAIVMRGPADAVALAEKVIRDLDKPKSEVVIDVIVMQANTARTRDLAASIVNASGAPGLTLPFSFTPRNPVLINGSGSGSTGTGTSTTTTDPTTGVSTTITTPSTSTGTTPAAAVAAGVSLAQLAHISTNDFSTTLPGALLNLIMTDSKTKVLNNPTVRASDGMKVSLAIGQKIPYATGSFQPGVGTVGVSPLVSTQFNFAEVGVNVDITPQVHANNEVTLHVEINVSSVAQYVTLGGLAQPVISQNKNIADIRLREGEVNILSGLTSSQDTKSYNGIPGLVNVPVLGHVLFGSDHMDKENGQLMIALVPHIIRSPDYSAENMRSIFAGSETNIKLIYAPTPEDAAPATPPAAPAGSPSAPPVTAAPNALPATALPVPGAVAPGTPGAPPAPAPTGETRVVFVPANVQVAPGNPLTLNIQIENVKDLFSGSPIHVKFDKDLLRLNDILPGDLFTRDNVRTTTQKDIRNDTGDATLTVTRLPGMPGISGTGGIVTLNFVAVGKGATLVKVTDAGLKNSQQQAITVAPAEISVRIQ